MPTITKPSIELIFDLRRFTDRADSSERIQTIWRQISHQLVGKHLSKGGSISFDTSTGNISLWIVDTNGITQFADDTEVEIVDVLRSPKLLYQCAVCGEYGPLRCVKCEEDGRETRLCSKHAHIIKDELSAYCPEHIPTCNCREGCREKAEFRCRSCARTNRQKSIYGQHFYKKHPHDDVDYCVRCYQRQFERCQAPGCNRPGRSKCHYQTRNMSDPCGASTCSDHNYQWKIWGPHNRGVTLCERHQGILSASDPADLIFLILTSKAPFAKRGRYHSMPNPFRLRRLINRNRATPVSFAQIESILKTFGPLVPQWGKTAERNFNSLMKSVADTIGSLDKLEREFLDQVKYFYQNKLGWDAASQILGLQIQDRFYKPGEAPRYRVRITVSGGKGRLIGQGGAHINELRKNLNIEIDLD